MITLNDADLIDRISRANDIKHFQSENQRLSSQQQLPFQNFD